jgi:hypothetical protein
MYSPVAIFLISIYEFFLLPGIIYDGCESFNLQIIALIIIPKIITHFNTQNIS